MKCFTGCMTCTGPLQADCTLCPPGQRMGTTQCETCPRNCQSCSSTSVCTECNYGFALVESSGVCRGCALKCSNCNPYDFRQCTECAPGLYLDVDQCKECPANCVECFGSECSECADGFAPNANGVCVQKC